MGAELDAQIIWSDDKQQLTIRTNMGKEAARKIADWLNVGVTWWMTHADENGWVDYVYWK